jgi:UDP-GlcNAc:undecaprenyl-phosphate/decaprenyl-phosphate GlcNAc-1-phosphate transferase
VSTPQAYGIVLLVAATTTFVCTPLVRRLALRVGAIDHPDGRHLHERPTAMLGGVAMLLGFLAGMAVAAQLDVLDQIFTNSTEPLGLVIAAVLMLAVGTIDDIRDVSPPAKFAGIVLCASVLVLMGVSMSVFRIPFVGVVSLSPDWSYLLSVVWVLGMTNAINFIDGLDGLAAGIVAIAAGTFFLYTMQLLDIGILTDGNIAPLVAVIVLGMCVGFLPFNFAPAKIFMGDGGALLLGLLMAASTMVVGGRVDQNVQFSGQTYFFFAPLFIPLFILGVPIFDTFIAIVRRAVKRKAPSGADNEHIHHRLVRLGHGQRRSVLILWGWTALLSILVLYPAYTDGELNAVVPVGIAALCLALYTVLHPGVRSTRADRRASAAEADAVVEVEAEPTVDLDAAEERPVATPGDGRDTDHTSDRPAARSAATVTPAEALAAFDVGARTAPGGPAEPPAGS